MEKIEKIDFKTAILSIGVIPASYVEAMSYYECMTWLLNFLQNTVIPVVNNNGEAVEELQNLYIQLQEYVNNYLNDEHLQPMINEKLDEMASDGTLADIVAQYVQLQGLLTYNSIEEMKEAENIALGSFLQTYGFYSNGDGGQAKYKARTITNEDTIDNITIIALSDNTLVAELLKDSTSNVKQFGAKADGTTSDSTAFQKMLDYCGYIYIPNGTYKLTQTINLDEYQTVSGQERDLTILNYYGTSSLFANGIDPNAKHISIHDLTVNGSDRQGTGIYFIQPEFNNTVYHYFYNLTFKYLDYGIRLEQHLNETNIHNIYCGSCNYSIFLDRIDDFYMSNIVSAGSYKDGLKMVSCSDAKIVNVKSWYSGVDTLEDSSADYYNIRLESCAVMNLTNIEAQEAYKNNYRIYYCHDLDMINFTSSRPNLLKSTNPMYSHFVWYSSYNCTLQAITNDTLVDGNFVSNMIYHYGDSYCNTINITPQRNYPNANIIKTDGSAQQFNFPLRNNIIINNKEGSFNPYINLADNGDLSDTSSLSMITTGSSYCSWVDDKVRITNNTSGTVSINWHRKTLPMLCNTNAVVKIESVTGSATGNVVLSWKAYTHIDSNESAGTKHVISCVLSPSNTNDGSDIQLNIPAGVIIDITGVFYGLGENSSIIY